MAGVLGGAIYKRRGVDGGRRSIHPLSALVCVWGDTHTHTPLERPNPDMA